jgi:hypothetical protein
LAYCIYSDFSRSANNCHICFLFCISKSVFDKRSWERVYSTVLLFCFVFELGGDGRKLFTKEELKIKFVDCSLQIIYNVYVWCLQASVLRAWGGKPENVKAAQNELIKRAKVSDMQSALCRKCFPILVYVTLKAMLKVSVAWLMHSRNAGLTHIVTVSICSLQSSRTDTVISKCSSAKSFSVLKIMVFWVVSLCSLERAQHFREEHHLHLYGQRGVTMQKTILFIVTAMRTSNPTFSVLLFNSFNSSIAISVECYMSDCLRWHCIQ